MSTRSVVGLALAVPVAIVVFFVVTASGPGLGSRRAEAECSQTSPDCLGDLAFKDTYNEIHPPEALAGKVVVVNFWATWCKPCKKEIPAFNRVFERYKDRGVAMFGVLQEDIAPTDLLNFASDYEMTYPIVPLDDALARKLGVASNIPTTYIYDQGGRRVFSKVGELSEAALAAELDLLLR
jgi:thiol-disulfide isomerase/thioredoxin